MEIFLSGITTLVAVFGLIYSLHESAKDRKIRTQESFKEQAKKVACWTKENAAKESAAKDVAAGFSGTSPYQTFTINNNSELPIYNVFIFSVYNKGEDSINNIKNAIELKQYSYHEIIAPGKLDDNSLLKNSSSGGGRSIPCLTFNDASGHAWFRSKHGRLEPIENYTNKLNEFGLHQPYMNNPF